LSLEFPKIPGGNIQLPNNKIQRKEEKMFSPKILVAVTLTLIVAILLTACSSSTTPSPSTAAKATTPPTTATTMSKPTLTDQPQYGGTLTVIETSSVASLGLPYIGSAGYAEYACPAIESLLRYDDKGDYKPCLATSWQITPDGKSITFMLRKGVKFHDGTNFNAEALKYNMQHVTSGAVLNTVASMDVIDEYTLRFNLKQYDVSLLQELCFRQGMIVSPTAAEKKPSPATMAKEQMVGTGPFKFVDWQKDVFVKYEKFNDYWDKGKPYLDGIEIRTVADPMTAVMTFKAGQGQLIMVITPRDATDLKAQGYSISSAPSVIRTLISDGSNPESPFADKRVREAIGYAIDRTALADKVGYGFWKASDQLFTAGEVGYLNGLEPQKYNPEKAKQLLASAGYANGFKTTFNAQTSDNRDVVAAVQAYLSDIGIQAELNICDRGKWSSIAQTGWKNGFVMVGLGQAYPPSNRIIFLTPYSTAVPTRSVFMPSGFMSLYDQTAATPDLNKYNEQILKLAGLIRNEAMITPLWSEPQFAAMQKSAHDTGACTDATPLRWKPGGAWLSK
jgi:peptide/nickel transport system substrate-binding protein